MIYALLSLSFLLAAVAAGLLLARRAGTPGVRRLTYNDRDCLAAYAKTGDDEALLQIAPVAELLAEATAVADDVRASIQQLYIFGTVIALAPEDAARRIADELPGLVARAGHPVPTVAAVRPGRGAHVLPEV